MAFDNERKRFVREHFWYCEVEVGANTYRFCENRSPLPLGFSAIPCMSSQSFRPAQVALDGGIGVRASCTVSFNEPQDYKIFGTLAAPVRFWVNWRARNPGYEGGRMSLFSGYIVDNEFDVINFQRRDYVIDSFSHSESGASISAKDALKLTSGDRAKAPLKSTGKLNADLTEFTGAFSLTPAGVGELEYPASGWVRLGDEIVSFTRVADLMTITRGQYNTVATPHSQDDDVQLCLYYNDTVTDIIYDLYTNYAGVPTAQIDKAQWDDEASIYLPGLFEALITEPVSVGDLVKELAEAAPHYQYWDERDNFIKFIAIKPPPDTAQVLTAEANLLRGSTSIKDMPEMRISTVIVRFGQHDPTKPLDEISNYRQAHLRVNPTAVAKYNGIEKYKVINSRWINNSNKAAAVRLAAVYGRRFEDTPRKVSFKLDAKDADIWTGTPCLINSDLVVSDVAPYARYNMPVQVISAGENKAYQYEALEHIYGPERDEDLGSNDPNQRLVVLSGFIQDINLRDIYDTLYPDVLDTYNIIFVFDNGCVAGSSSTALAGTDTGSWPELITSKILLDVRGLLVGKGGNGGMNDGFPGGPALRLNTDVDIKVTGQLKGGGGGGGGALGEEGGDTGVGGGGGAGYAFGLKGSPEANNGTSTLGGTGGRSGSERGGTGGALGMPGGNGNVGSGGAAGAAIILNGYTATYL